MEQKHGYVIKSFRWIIKVTILIEILPPVLEVLQSTVCSWIWQCYCISTL